MPWPKNRLKLRSKLLIISLVLLLLPWLGARYLQAVEGLLQQQQAQSMATIAKASSILISEYVDELSQRKALLEASKSSDSIAVVSMTSPIHIDGYQDDWLPYRSRLTTLSTQNQLVMGEKVDPQDISARYLFLQDHHDLTLLLDVVDDSIVFRDPSQHFRHGGDAIILAFTDSHQRVHRYILSSSSFGHINVYQYIGSYLDPVIIQQQTAIKALWKQSNYGYRLELILPVSLLTDDMSLAIIDIDKAKSATKVVGLADVRDSALFSPLLLPSITLSSVLDKMAVEGLRLWLIDTDLNVFSSAGQGRVVMDEPELNSLLDLFYQLLLKPTISDDESLSHEQTVLTSDVVHLALKGDKASQQQIEESAITIMMAAQPIIIEGEVLGAVVAEKNTHDILGLQNKAVKTLFQITAIVLIVVLILLLGFASRLSFRIKRLNDDVSNVVSGDGKVSAQFSSRIEYDELGELRQCFSQLLERLGLYTHYLEALASRLAHELRTPIAVIRTSLEHLETDPSDKQVYIDRAREGSERLNNIVSRMSEASRLEQTVNNVSLVEFDLGLLLNELLPIYQDIYAEEVIELDNKNEQIIILGLQELIVQMLDKLIANAVDFRTPETTITLELEESKGVCQLKVINEGRALPEEMHEQLFQAMVSIRQTDLSSNMPHLGLGLYIVKMIAERHQGIVNAKNRVGKVEFCVELPITNYRD